MIGTHAIRRFAAGVLAVVLPCAALSGCVPSNAAVGDTQSSKTAVSHSMEDRNSLSVAMIGSGDIETDRMAMDAMKSGKLKPIYITVSGTDDPQETARQGVQDMAQRKADVIVIAGIDVNDTNRQAWNDALQCARQAGIPVALLNPVHKPKDAKLYAASLVVNDRMTDAKPLADVVVSIANDDPHGRSIFVTTNVGSDDGSDTK